MPHWYTDADTMFRERNLGLVDIVTRMDTHLALARMAARHNVPMIVQKPFAPTIDDVRKIVATAEEAGLFLAVHENFRFQTPLQKVKEVIASGVIGEPSWARISFRTGYDIYEGQPYFYGEERFVILDLGVHVVDIARYFLGEIAHVSCETQRRNPKVKAEDTATMLCRHTSGAVSVVECTYETKKLPDPFPETLVRDRRPARGDRDEARLPHGGHGRRRDDRERDRDSDAALGEEAVAHDRGERLQDLPAPAREPAGGARGRHVGPRQPEDLRGV